MKKRLVNLCLLFFFMLFFVPGTNSCRKNTTELSADEGMEIFVNILVISMALSDDPGYTRISLYETTSPTAGDFGGRAGGDAFCVAHKPASVSCRGIRAFISVSSEYERLRYIDYKYNIPSGAAITDPTGVNAVADRWYDLFSGSLKMSFQAAGIASSPYYLTGTRFDGEYASDCFGFTGKGNVNYGDANSVTGSAIGMEFPGPYCSTPVYPILCICLN